MQYQYKSFSVVTGSRDPKGCTHGWTDAKGRCVMCGEITGPSRSEARKWLARVESGEVRQFYGKGIAEMLTVVSDSSVPPGEIHIVQDGEVTGKLFNFYCEEGE